MKNKFNRLDEVYLLIKGQKVYGLVKSFEHILLDNEPTFKYIILLVRPLTFTSTNLTFYELDVIEKDLTNEKFPMSEAEKSNSPIIIP